MKKQPVLLLHQLLLLLIISSCQKMAEQHVQQVSPSQASTVLSTLSSSDNRIIDLENASLGTGSILTDDGYSYAFITKGTYNTPYITNSDQYRGCNSIAYAMPPTTVSGSITNDKSQHRIFSGSDANALAFGVKKYFGFAIKPNNAMPQPTSTVQIFQVWQGTPMSPPVELRLMPGGSGATFNYELRIRNNNTTANPSAGVSVYSGTISRGQWNTFVIMTIMRNTADSQDGQIKLWQNGTLMIQWNGRAGYADGIVYAGTAYTPNAKFDAFFGPYRPCQNVSLLLYYDEIRYGGAYTEADPDNGSVTCN